MLFSSASPCVSSTCMKRRHCSISFAVEGNVPFVVWDERRFAGFADMDRLTCCDGPLDSLLTSSVFMQVGQADPIHSLPDPNATHLPNLVDQLWQRACIRSLPWQAGNKPAKE